MKKLVSLLLALVMLTSCVGAMAELKGTADGKLTIWTWDPTFNIAAMKVAAEMYQKDHPDVEITIEEIQSTDIEQKISTAITGGDMSILPDIYLNQDNSFQRGLVNYPEAMLDVTGKFDFANFGAGKLAYSMLDGKNYGIPFDAGTVVGTYRIDYLAEAGYTVADLENITWTRFLEIGRDIKAKTGRPMLSGEAGSVDMVMIMLQSCGASLFNEDGSVNMVNNEPLKVVLDVYNTMVKEGIFIEVNSWDEYIGTLTNESVVGTINGCWILGTILSQPNQAGKWALTNMPALEGVEGATNYSNNGGSSWAIIPGTDEELAIDFMQLYTNADFYNAILPTTSAIATYAPAKEAPNYAAGNEFYNGQPIFATIVEYTAHVPSNITGTYYYDARTALGTAKTNIIQGADIASELQIAEDTVNFTMGF